MLLIVGILLFPAFKYYVMWYWKYIKVRLIHKFGHLSSMGQERLLKVMLEKN